MVFSNVGSVHETLLQHLYLRLLLGRSFVDLAPRQLARLVGAMSQVQHYHTGLLREVVAYLGEEGPIVAASLTVGDITGMLRTFGLAPVPVPLRVLRLFGCRLRALLKQADVEELRSLFEVGPTYPEVLRACLGTCGAEVLRPRRGAGTGRSDSTGECSGSGSSS